MAPPPTPSSPPAKPPTNPTITATILSLTRAQGDEHASGPRDQKQPERELQEPGRESHHRHRPKVGAYGAAEGKPGGQAPIDVAGHPVACQAGRGHEHDRYQRCAVGP